MPQIGTSKKPRIKWKKRSIMKNMESKNTEMTLGLHILEYTLWYNWNNYFKLTNILWREECPSELFFRSKPNSQLETRMDVISVCDSRKNESILRRESKKMVRATFQRLLQSVRQRDREILLALIRRVSHLSYKLRCCKKIFGLEKSHNNAREKIRWFFSLVFDIANKLLTHLSVF